MIPVARNVSQPIRTWISSPAYCPALEAKGACTWCRSRKEPEGRLREVLDMIADEKNSTIVFPAQFMSTIEDVKNFIAKEK